jgi:long-chain fatty acid transport protein
VETLNWTDTWRYAVGANYYHNDRLTFRTGVAYDETPLPNAASRTPRLPDNDRLWLSVGASYRVSDRLSADIGYAHLFIDDTPIRRTGSTGSVLIGNYESEADIFSVQVNYVFD